MSVSPVWKLVCLNVLFLLVVSTFAPFVVALQTSSGFYSSSGSFSSTTNTYQSTSPSISSVYGSSVDDYWPILSNLENDDCSEANSDFIIAIPPLGCSPTVVRSDLLAEQNVPVFCQLSAIKVNPLIDVSSIKSISFKGDYPEEVAGISFHPARAAVNSYETLLGDPIEENIGYVVIVLKKQPDERNLEDYISGMLTATITYDAEGAFGTGAGEYYLEPMTDDEWETQSPYYSFWGSKGYLRVSEVDSDSATIEVLTSKDNVYRKVTLKEGETSSKIYYPGYYCTAALSVKLNKIDNSEDMARLDVDGDIFWVREGSSILDGKCKVTDLNVYGGGTGEVEIKCSGSNKFQLVLGDQGALFEVNGESVQALVGSELKGTSKSYYLGYYHSIPSSVSDKENKKSFAILSEEKLTEDVASYITSVYENGEFKTLSELKNALQDSGSTEHNLKSYSILYDGGLNEVDGIVFGGLYDGKSTGKYAEDSGVQEYLEKAKKATLELMDNYPAEKKASGDYWGEEALYKQVMIAGQAGDEEMQVELINLFLEKYPESTNYNYLRDMKTNLNKFEFGEASKNIVINNENYYVFVDGFMSGVDYDESVNMRIDGGVLRTFKKGSTYNSKWEEVALDSSSNVVPRFSITDIDGASARFNYVYWKDDDKKSSTSKSFTIEEGSYENVGGHEFKLDETNVHEVAYVSLIPEVLNTKTEANFTFNIGIEERALEITPEQARNKIDELNETITKWEERLEKLGNVISGFKGACYTISSVLILKNLFNGFKGESMARSEIMDAYEKKCREEGASTSAELQVCYSKYSSEIEADVDEYSAALMSVNSKVKCAETGETVSSEFLDSKVINGEKYVSQLSSCADLSNDWSYTIGGTTVTKAHLTDASDYQAVLLYEELGCSSASTSAACQKAREDLESALADNVEQIKSNVMKQVNEKNLGVGLDFASNNKKSINANYKTVTKKFGDINEGSKVSAVEYNGVNYYAVIGDDDRVTGVYSASNGEEVTSIGKNKAVDVINGAYDFFGDSSTSSCSNKMTNAYVRYYESSNKQGFAGIVPLNINDGWYVYVEQDDYTAAGVANAFWICNVGKDGLIGEGTKGGDKCQRFSTSVGATDSFIPCKSLGSSKVNELYNKAEEKIREANNNKNGVTVGGKFISSTTPMSSTTNNLECTDFMSVDDCNLMFNVCDPVICPSSRCDLGGKFPVNDVISTGIIGSIVLCLPNFGSPSEGGVLIPVCLSGIHAGLDSYVSILRSYRDCLQENIDSGEYVGVCDEITSIYLCEFFWGQMSPILNAVASKVIESLYTGSQTKGGAEYLTVSKAFDNLDNSIDYFTSNYAKNAFEAFQLKNVEEVGSTVCEAFVGSSAPTSVDAIESLLEPESPTQFYAYFSESLYSEATVPSTSHYKVYYHIYAGNDAGVQYKVYLTNPPESSYYSSNQVLLVDSGYVSAGDSADESVDFTAPSGYQELCVNINGEEECGFESVTSNFALNYASQAYVADQVDDTSIITTSDCVTTSTSAWGLVSPNLQSGTETAIGGEDISNSGIVRVCASSNPEEGVISGNEIYCKVDENVELDSGIKSNPNCGSGYYCVAISVDDETVSNVGVCTDSNGNREVSQGRWIDVGYCDDTSVRCWLDSESVEDSLSAYMKINNITSVSALVADSADLEELKEEYATVREKLIAQRNLIEGLSEDELVGGEAVDSTIVKIVNALDEVIGVDGEHTGQGTDNDKAEALALKASLYRAIVQAIINTNPELKFEGATENSYLSDEETAAALAENAHTLAEEFSEVASESQDYAESYNEGEAIPVTINEKNYYLKYDSPSFFSSEKWLFSTNENDWNEVLESNAIFGFLFGKDFDEGIQAIIDNGAFSIALSESMVQKGVTGSVVETLEYGSELGRQECSNFNKLTWSVDIPGAGEKSYSIRVCKDSFLINYYNDRFGEFKNYCVSSMDGEGKVQRVFGRPYPVFVMDTKADKYIEDVAAQIKDLATKEFPNDEKNQKAFIGNFVEKAITYKSDEECYDCIERAAYPYEVLYRGEGDCEDSAILLSKLFSIYGFYSCFYRWEGNSSNHLNNGVQCDDCEIVSDKTKLKINDNYIFDSTPIVGGSYSSFNSVWGYDSDVLPKKTIEIVSSSYLVIKEQGDKGTISSYYDSNYRLSADEFSLFNYGNKVAKAVYYEVYLGGKKIGSSVKIANSIAVDKFVNIKIDRFNLGRKIQSGERVEIKLYSDELSSATYLYWDF